MLKVRYFEKFGMGHLVAEEPFSLKELLSLVRTHADTHQSSRILLDLRRVDLSKFSGSKIQEFMVKKKQILGDRKSPPTAYVVSNLQDHSKLRLAGIYADLLGVSREQHMYITQDLDAALDWLGVHDRIEHVVADNILNLPLANLRGRA